MSKVRWLSRFIPSGTPCPQTSRGPKDVELARYRDLRLRRRNPNYISRTADNASVCVGFAGGLTSPLLRYIALLLSSSLHIPVHRYVFGGGRCFVELLRKRAFTAARSFAYRCLGLQARWQKQAIKRRPSYGAVCVAASLASRRPVLHLHAPLARLGGMPPRAHAALQRPSFN